MLLVGCECDVVGSESNPWREMWESAGWIAHRVIVVIVAVSLLALAGRILMLRIKRDGGLTRQLPTVGLILEILANFGMSWCDYLHYVADLLISSRTQLWIGSILERTTCAIVFLVLSRFLLGLRNIRNYSANYVLLVHTHSHLIIGI